MERGLEVDVPSIASIRVLFIDRERIGLYLGVGSADVFKAETAIKFGDILGVTADTDCKLASRVAIRHKENGRAQTLEFDVDTNKSRDILTEMIGKLVTVYRTPKPAAQEITLTGALSSVISNLGSFSLWGGGSTGTMQNPTKPTSPADARAAYRRQLSNEGRDLFRNSMDSPAPTPR